MLSVDSGLLSPHILNAPIMFSVKQFHMKIIILLYQSHPKLFWSLGVGAEIWTVKFSNRKPSRLSDLIYVTIVLMYSEKPKLLLRSHKHTFEHKRRHKKISYLRLRVHGPLYMYVDLTVTRSLTTCHRHLVYALTQHVPRAKKLRPRGRCLVLFQINSSTWTFVILRYMK